MLVPILLTRYFYTKLYRNLNQEEASENIPYIPSQGSEEMNTITEEEVLKSLSEMKNNKSPGELLKAITKLFINA